MNRSLPSSARFFSVGMRIIATFITAVPAYADIYTDLPAGLVGYDSTSEIHIHSVADATAVRQRTIDYLWGGAGLPTGNLPTSTTVYMGGGTLPTDLYGLNPAYIAGADKWQANMDFGYSTSMYLLRPVNTANAQRLVIVHHGHAGYSIRFNDQIGVLTDQLLQNGFTVLSMEMPLMGWNTQTSFNLPSGTVSLTSHDAMVNTLEGQPGGSALRFFLEPVVQGVNKFLQTNPNYTDISMIGLSGGGWTTTLAPAIDTRIKLSIPVAGSEPLYARSYYPGSVGDKEQYLSTMYDAATGKASYLDLYTLGSTGAGRRQIQVTNQYDNCCFYGVPASTWVNNTKNAVGATGSGTYDYYLDSTENVHEITSNSRWNVILPALGISPPLPAAPAINEHFTAAGSPPPGWRYDPTNNGTPVITSSGGIVTFPAGSGVKSIVYNGSFDIQSKPITATLKITKIGSGGYLGMFFSEDPFSRFHDFGLQVNSSGALILNSDHGGTFKQVTLTTLSGYNGGPITLTLSFDSLGFTASTDYSNYNSGRMLWSSLTNSFSLKDVGMEAFTYIQYYGSSDTGKVDGFTVVPEPSASALLPLGTLGILACVLWRCRHEKSLGNRRQFA
jgi:hypothetical protein